MENGCLTDNRFGLQHDSKFILSPEMALGLASGAGFGCNRHCKTNIGDLEGSQGQVLVVLGGFWKVLGGREGCKNNFPLWPQAGYD